jgi:glycosyl transferase family 25
MNEHRPKASGQALLEGLGKFYVINLPHRTDRRREFARQLQRIGLSYDTSGVTLFPAIRPDGPAGFPTLGTRGCFMSHLGVLKTAVADKAECIIVCEDDLDFSQDILDRLPKVLIEAASQPWDILYLGHGGLQTLPPDPDGKALIRLEPDVAVLATHFLVFRRSAHSDLVSYLQAILGRPPGHPDGGPMHVDGAFSRFRADHRQLITLAAIPPLGYQRPSRTDVHTLRFYDRLPGLQTVANLARQWVKSKPRRDGGIT